MPEFIGTAQCVRVGDDFGFTSVVEQTTGVQETFILWWGGITTPADPPFHVRIVQSDWVSLLRESIAGGLTVAVTHPTNSAAVLNIQLGR